MSAWQQRSFSYVDYALNKQTSVATWSNYDNAFCEVEMSFATKILTPED